MKFILRLSFISDIEPDFRQQLQILVEHLLAPEKLVVKEINGSQVSCRELVEYFKVILYFLLISVIIGNDDRIIIELKRGKLYKRFGYVQC